MNNTYVILFAVIGIGIIFTSVVFVAPSLDSPVADQQPVTSQDQLDIKDKVTLQDNKTISGESSHSINDKPVYIKSLNIFAENKNQRFAQDIHIDNDGFIYVTGIGDHRTGKYDKTGDIKFFVGIPGPPYNNTESSSTELGNLRNPNGITIDEETGIIYIAESSNNRIQYFASDGQPLGFWGSSGTEPGNFKSPSKITFDTKQELLYVADSGNNRIQIFDKEGNFIDTFGKGGPSIGHFNIPRGITVNDMGIIYVADSENDRIQIINKSLEFVSEKKGFTKPIDIDLDSKGNIYVLENFGGSYHGIIKKFDRDWNKLYTLTTRDFTDQYIPFENYEVGFEGIVGFDIGSDDTVYILDKDQGVHIFTP